MFSTAVLPAFRLRTIYPADFRLWVLVSFNTCTFRCFLDYPAAFCLLDSCAVDTFLFDCFQSCCIYLGFGIRFSRYKLYLNRYYLFNGDGGIRTLDPLLARQVLSQLSYTPNCSFKCSGSHLLSHAVPSIVPSAARVLTIVFGMGTCVPPGRIATGTF